MVKNECAKLKNLWQKPRGLSTKKQMCHELGCIHFARSCELFAMVNGESLCRFEGDDVQNCRRFVYFVSRRPASKVSADHAFPFLAQIVNHQSPMAMLRRRLAA